MTTGAPPLTEYQCVLVERWVGLAQHIAVSFWKRSPGNLDRDEMVSVAYQGLVTAALKFDPERRPTDSPDHDPQVAFAAFARMRISGAVQDWMRKQDFLPKEQRRTYRNMQRMAPGTSAQQAADTLGLDVARVNAITYAVATPPVSLDLICDTHGYDKPHASGDTADGALTHLVQEAVVEVFETMTPEEKSVLSLRYYKGYTFAQIAVELGITLSRAKTVHQESVAVIHSVMLHEVS